MKLALLAIFLTGCATPHVPTCMFPQPLTLEIDDAPYFVFDMPQMVSLARVTHDLVAGRCAIRKGEEV